MDASPEQKSQEGGSTSRGCLTVSETDRPCVACTIYRNSLGSNSLSLKNFPGEILASLDNGASWTIEATGLLDTTGNPAQMEHLSVQASTGAIFALSEGRLHRSSGIGQPWTSANLPAAIDFPNGIHFDAQDSSRLFITALSGLFAGLASRTLLSGRLLSRKHCG
jgi:hypothetical protein